MHRALFALFAISLHAQVLLEQREFPAGDPPPGWRVWSQRAETSPRAWVDTSVSRGPESNSLALSGGSNSAVFGGWQRPVPGIVPGFWYRLTVSYRAASLDNEHLHVLARIDWRNAAEKRAGQPEYGVRTVDTAGFPWRTVQIEAPAPAGATVAVVELLLGNSPQATVWWDDLRFERVEHTPRLVRVSAVRLRPRGSRTVEENVRKFIDQADRGVTSADLILLSEGITTTGTGMRYVDGAEPVPGPTTKALGELAKRKHAYVVAGLFERDGAAVYNTAVLLDRSGALVGRYRKVYLPREEIEGGLTPGMDYPVFQTDFGKLGMMICWDVQYPDPARMLALHGAEVIAMPIAGGNQVLGKARAIENQVFLVSSGYDYPTEIVDPQGETLARAEENPGIAASVIDLARRYDDAWLGNMRQRRLHEMRLDLVPPQY